MPLLPLLHLDHLNQTHLSVSHAWTGEHVDVRIKEPRNHSGLLLSSLRKRPDRHETQIKGSLQNLTSHNAHYMHCFSSPMFHFFLAVSNRRCLPLPVKGNPDEAVKRRHTTAVPKRELSILSAPVLDFSPSLDIHFSVMLSSRGLVLTSFYVCIGRLQWWPPSRSALAKGVLYPDTLVTKWTTGTLHNAVYKPQRHAFTMSKDTAWILLTHVSLSRGMWACYGRSSRFVSVLFTATSGSR